MNRRFHLALALPVVALAVAGCGSGRHNENYSEHSVVNGVSYRSGGLGIYNAVISYPAAKGGTTNVLFSVYADDTDSTNTLRSVTAATIANTPAALGRITGGKVAPEAELTIDHQYATGSTLSQATFSDLSAPVIAGAYYPVTFAFSTGLTTTLEVPVALNGAINPASTIPPSALPDQPFTAASAAP